MTSVLSAGAERLPPPPTILQQPESVHYPFENQFTSENQEADMGFFAGFFSGFALTTTALYLTVQVHRSIRLEQRDAIRQQTQALNWLSSPIGAYDRRLAPKDSARPDNKTTEPVRPTMEDLLKHHWNQEVEKLAKKANESRWEDMRETAQEGWKTVVRLVKRE